MAYLCGCAHSSTLHPLKNRPDVLEEQSQGGGESLNKKSELVLFPALNITNIPTTGRIRTSRPLSRMRGVTRLLAVGLTLTLYRN